MASQAPQWKVIPVAKLIALLAAAPEVGLIWMHQGRELVVTDPAFQFLGWLDLSTEEYHPVEIEELVIEVGK